MFYKLMDDTYQRLELTGFKEVEDIHTFIVGVGNGISLADPNVVDEEYQHFSNFLQFVEKHYELTNNYRYWTMIIRYNSSTYKSRETIFTFFELFYKFRGIDIYEIPIPAWVKALRLTKKQIESVSEL